MIILYKQLLFYTSKNRFYDGMVQLLNRKNGSDISDLAIIVTPINLWRFLMKILFLDCFPLFLERSLLYEIIAYTVLFWWVLDFCYTCYCPTMFVISELEIVVKAHSTRAISLLFPISIFFLIMVCIPTVRSPITPLIPPQTIQRTSIRIPIPTRALKSRIFDRTHINYKINPEKILSMSLLVFGTRYVLSCLKYFSVDFYKLLCISRLRSWWWYFSCSRYFYDWRRSRWNYLFIERFDYFLERWF